MLLMPRYPECTVADGIRQVQRHQTVLLDLLPHRGGCESHTEIRFDEIKDRRRLVYFVRHARGETRLMAKAIDHVA